MRKNRKIIISGGGTGGHIFPAVAIANALKNMDKDIEILFVGAQDRMEMDLIPKAGYEIVGLPVVGLQRRLTIKNISFVFKLLKSLKRAKNIIKHFGPDAVVGVGGYASGPVLRIAIRRKIPALIQEQNSYAGITNRILSKKVKRICVAYDGMEKYFPAEKIVLTGNPVRQDILNQVDKAEAYKYFGLAADKKVILILGGSLGARTINNSMLLHLDKITGTDVQFLWQTGKNYYQNALNEAKKIKNQNVFVKDFINRMDYAYAVADVVVSRAGAGTISELCLVAKPCILIPSPNVAEDHQTKNAMALVNKNAAILVSDSESENSLVNKALLLIKDQDSLQQLSNNIAKLALKDSANRIANEVLNLMH